MVSFSQSKKLNPTEVADRFYENIRAGVRSGELLFDIHEDFPFTRPGLPRRRLEKLDTEGDAVRRGLAARAFGRLAINLATLADVAGRQLDPGPAEITRIGAHVVALGVLDDRLNTSESPNTMSARALAEDVGNWRTELERRPATTVIRAVEEEGAPVITVGIALDAANVAFAILIDEASQGPI